MRKLQVALACFVFALFFFYFNRHLWHTPQIYDCFLFYNELDLLELRLEEMYASVDRFVIVEADQTFRGAPKPLHYPAHAERFRKFSDKILYIPVEGGYATENPWSRERYQRDQIMRGLKECKKNDIILISDLDEIVRREKIAEVASHLLDGVQLVVLSQRMYFGYLNRYRGPWKGTVGTTYAQVSRLTPKIVRKLRHLKPKRLRNSKISHFLLIEEGGWHFSSAGGVDRYLDKVRAFSHSELDTAEYTQKGNLNRILRGCPLVPLDETFPEYVRTHESHFREIGFLD